MVNPIQCPNVSIPLQYDIQVSVTREATARGTDFSQILFCTPEATLNGDLPIGAGRVRYYLTLQEVIDTYGTNGEAYNAARVFFAQNPKPLQLGIGQIFTDPQAGFMKTGVVASVATLQAVTDGSFGIVINGVAEDITGLDFSTAANYDDIAVIIEAALQAVATGGYTAATVTASAISGSGVTFTFKSGMVGDGSTVSTLAATVPAIGTDISGSGYLNARTSAATVQAGYTPLGLVSELGDIQEAATCQGRGGFGFILDNMYADTQDQLDAAAWVAASGYILGIDTFNPLTIEAGSTSTNAYALKQTSNKNTFGLWSDVRDDLDAHVEYKAMGALALQLSWNTSVPNSYFDITNKNIESVTPSGVTTNELSTLKTVLTNVITTEGYGNRVIKSNYTYSSDWSLDETVAILNMIKDIQVAVFDVMLKSRSLPFNEIGQAKINQALSNVGDKYVKNGTLAARTDPDSTQDSGNKTIKPYSIIFPPLSSVTPTDRADKIYRGIQFIVQLAGQIHQVTIQVEVQG